MKSYKLSIVIPTKNRQRYCIEAIQQILSLNIEGIEICIQDNSDNNNLESQIVELKNESIIYNYHQGILSFVDNFSEAVSLAHGEFMCIIGDDDGILPSIESVVNHAKANNIDSVIPSLGCVYYWPSEHPIIKDGEKGVLSLSYIKQKVNVQTLCMLCKSFFRSAVQDYTSLDIPRLYHGIVRKDCLDRIKAFTGTYFDGLTPDMYMATALCFVCKKTLRIDYPITISGICPTSGSTDSATGKHTGKLSAAPHFRGHTDYKWDELIPAFYSVDTIWAETLLHALNNFKSYRLRSEFNLPLFEFICITKYPDFKECIFSHASTNNVSAISIKLQKLFHLKALLLRKIDSQLHPKTKMRFTNVHNIDEACSLSMEYFNKIVL